MESQSIENALAWRSSVFSRIHVDNMLRIRDHAEITVVNANKILGLIRRSYEYLDAVT